jgi:uncharacterized protein YyaL (SSP411 family)
LRISAPANPSSLDPATGELREGFFYAWRSDELRASLQAAGCSESDADAFCKRHGVREGGNCSRSARSDPHGEFAGLNVLFCDASNTLLDPIFAAQREALFAARAALRPPPRRDDKQIAAWNGMAISSLSRASRILPAFPGAAARCWPCEGLQPSAYLAAAARAAASMRAKLYDEQSATLRRCFLKTASASRGFADDYAWMVLGLCDLFEASGDVQWLEWALTLDSTLTSRFGDASRGGGYFSSEEGADVELLLRLRDDYVR